MWSLYYILNSMQIIGSSAFKGAIRNKFRNYPDRADARYDDHLILPSVDPSFYISQASSVFTIGSCFARNVEDSLQSFGISVPTAKFVGKKDEAPGRSNRILNQYNPGTMLQCVRAAGRPVNEAGLYAAPDGQMIDCLLATGSRPVSPERARERRAQINTLYSEGLKGADTVVITLGLIEAWYDRQHTLYLNEVPPRKELTEHGSRFEFRRMGVEECRTLISEMIENLTADRIRNIVLTVSPVPLQVTFAGGDAVTSNSYSKSVLRVVCELITEQFANVDYFPSYEIVSTAGLRAYGVDNVHVRQVVVDRIIAYMMSKYLKA